jgi:hypothetical protein
MRAGNPQTGRVGCLFPQRPAAAAYIVWMLSIPAAFASGPANQARPSEPALTGPRTVAVLDPVDLTTDLPDAVAGKLLRQSLAENPAWRVLSGDSIAKQLRDLGMDPDHPCSEFQCAFDAGNALQSEFVLFGTSTDLPEVNAYTIGLAHIPTSQMVWSRVGQAPKRPGEERHVRRGTILQGPLKFAVSDLDPASLDLRKRPSLGLLGVMDGGQSTPQSRVALHRALAHAYASRSYDMLGPAELDDLVAALDLDHSKGDPPADAMAAGTGPASSHGLGGSALSETEGADMLALGKQMSVRYLLRSEVRNEGGQYAMDLSLYDVAAGRKIRAWPSRETTDYASLLNLEDRFMTALGEEGPTAARPLPSNRHPWRSFFKGSTVGLAVLGAGALGYMAWQSHVQADQAYNEFKAAKVRSDADQARARVVAKDAETRKFGLIGGLTLALGVVVWSF